MTEKERVAGRSLDAEVAERVMGWSKADFRYAAERIAPTPNSDGTHTHTVMGAGEWSYEEAWIRSERENAKGTAVVGTFAPVVDNVPDYSESIAEAMQVMEAMRAKGFKYRVGSGFVDDLSACFWMPTGFVATYVVEGKLLPLIICQCALKALDAQAHSPSAVPTALPSSDPTENHE